MAGRAVFNQMSSRRQVRRLSWDWGAESDQAVLSLPDDPVYQDIASVLEQVMEGDMETCHATLAALHIKRRFLKDTI